MSQRGSEITEGPVSQRGSEITEGSGSHGGSDEQTVRSQRDQ